MRYIGVKKKRQKLIHVNGRGVLVRGRLFHENGSARNMDKSFIFTPLFMMHIFIQSEYKSHPPLLAFRTAGAVAVTNRIKTRLDMFRIKSIKMAHRSGIRM